MNTKNLYLTTEELKWMKTNSSKEQFSEAKKFLNNKPKIKNKKAKKSKKINNAKSNEVLIKNTAYLSDIDWNIFNRKKLMDNTTDSERKFYEILDDLGVLYVKQYFILSNNHKYFADVFIPEANLIIEIDGGYHYTTEQKELDAERTENLNMDGYDVVRIKNADAGNYRYVKMKLELNHIKFYGIVNNKIIN